MDVVWQKRGAHSVNLTNINGTIYVHDTQNGTSYKLKDYLSTHKIKPSMTAVIRSDNLKIKNNLSKDVVDKMFVNFSNK